MSAQAAVAAGAATASTSSTSLPFPCAQCLVSYSSSEEQRAHMRGDWHVYNLKRRIASLPPVSSAAFEDFVKAQEDGQDAASQDGVSCVLCKKTYQTPKQLKGHLRSQKHAQELEKQQDAQRQSLPAASSSDIDVTDEGEAGSSDGSSDSGQDFDPAACLFCNLDSSSTDENMLHMNKAHGLFIPDQEYLIDLESLLSYLSLLIVEFNECLYCGTIKGSVEGAQHHMTSKGHCMINLDEKSKLEDFYDFPEDQTTQTMQDTSDQRLQLSSGKSLGHRSLAHLYKQSLPTRPSPSNANQQSLLTSGPSDSTNTPSSSNATSKALVMRSSDAQSLIGLSTTQQHSLRAVQKKMLKTELRARAEYQRKVEKGGNSQKYFKPDVPGPKNG